MTYDEAKWQVDMARARAEVAGHRAAIRIVPWYLLGAALGWWLGKRMQDDDAT